MGTELAVIPKSRFLALDETSKQVRALRANMQYSSVKSSDLIRVKAPSGGGTAWTINSARGETFEKELVGVIVHMTARRTLWADKSVGSGDRPVCSSDDLYRGKLRTGDDGKPNVPDKIMQLATPGGKEGLCAGCYFNEWGTAIDQAGNPTRGKRCSEARSLFLLRESDILPMRVNVPVGSLGDFNKWLAQISNEGVCFNECLVKFHLEKEKNRNGTDFAKLVPQLIGPLSDDAVASLSEYAKLLKATFERAADEDMRSPPQEAASNESTEDAFGFGGKDA